jgi:hypothetical protein
MSNPDKLVDLTLDLKHETEKAYLVWTGKKGQDPVWVAKSLVERDGRIFTMPTWLAEERGLI